MFLASLALAVTLLDPAACALDRPWADGEMLQWDPYQGNADTVCVEVLKGNGVAWNKKWVRLACQPSYAFTFRPQDFLPLDFETVVAFQVIAVRTHDGAESNPSNAVCGGVYGEDGVDPVTGVFRTIPMD